MIGRMALSRCSFLWGSVQTLGYRALEAARCDMVKPCRPLHLHMQGIPLFRVDGVLDSQLGGFRLDAGNERLEYVPLDIGGVDG